MADPPPFVDYLVERRVTVVTVVVDDLVISNVSEVAATGATRRAPRHLQTIQQPIVTTDPRAQHDQVVAAVRAGAYERQRRE